MILYNLICESGDRVKGRSVIESEKREDESASQVGTVSHITVFRNIPRPLENREEWMGNYVKFWFQSIHFALRGTNLNVKVNSGLRWASCHIISGLH